MMPDHRALLLVAVVVAVVATGPFVLDPAASTPEPAEFDNTIHTGGTLAERQATPDDVHLPVAQVFYSRYRYVVGYYSVDIAATTYDESDRIEQLGQPQAVYVTDFARSDLSLTDQGYPSPDRPAGWVQASDAWFVVDSDAQTPTETPVALPFSDRDAAVAFVDQHGGQLVDWETIGAHGADQRTDPTTAVDDRHAAAEQLIDEVGAHADRPVSTVVGDDAPTVAAAVEAAPPDTAVVVPSGSYNETIEIDRPISLVGPDATLSGDGTGTVVRVTAPDAAIIGLTIDGVGDDRTDPDAAAEDTDAWDHNVEAGYGHGDAGVAVIDAPGVLVDGVEIHTPANGVLYRDSPDAVVRNSTVVGTDDWRDGFMGVVAMRSPGVVERSTFEGGRDGVYTHRSDGIVVRDNAMADQRYGVHLMYTSDALVADNCIRGGDLGGITIMTSPTGIAVVGNDVRGSRNGIATSGTGQYVAGNVLVDNGRALAMASPGSVYEHNVAADNDIGFRSSEILPTSTVVDNDIVDNEQPVETRPGPLRIWSQDDTGNYWGPVPGTVRPDGRIDRPFVPSAPLDVEAARTPGAVTVAQAPGLQALRGVLGTVPGLRSGSIVDRSPQTGTVANATETGRLCDTTEHGRTVSTTGNATASDGDRTDENNNG